MKIFIYDTETTGLLKPNAISVKEQPYIIELYGCVIDEEFNLLEEIDTFLKPPIPLPDIITKITGLEDKDLEDAITFADFYPDLAKIITGCDAIVAHNLQFDLGMIANELIRLDKLVQFPWPRHHICTVQSSMPVRGHRLKLSQLHEIATGKGFEGAHRAKADVHALVRCFHWLSEKGYIDLKALEK